MRKMTRMGFSQDARVHLLMRKNLYGEARDARKELSKLNDMIIRFYRTYHTIVRLCKYPSAMAKHRTARDQVVVGQGFENIWLDQ